MSKSDIRSWIVAAQDDASDDGQLPLDIASAAINEEEDWAMFKIIAQRRLLGDGKRGRVEFIKEQLSVVAARGDISQEQSLDILHLLMLTYPRYADSDSRNVVLDCLSSLLRRDIDPPAPQPHPLLISHTLISWIAKEASHFIAGSNSFVLLTWIAAAFTASAKSETFPVAKTFNVVVSTMAVLVDAVIREGKSGASRSAFVLVRRVLRNNHTLIPGVVSSLFDAAKSSSAPLNNAVLIGIAVDVALRLRPNKANEESPGVTYVGLIKSNVLTFYTTHVIPSKTTVPPYITKSFNDFLQHCTTDDDLTNAIVPAVEKAVLRAPEISLDTVNSLLHALSRPLPTLLFTRVLTSVLNAAKSTNAVTRAGAIRVVTTLLATPSSLTPSLPGAPPHAILPESDDTQKKNVETARQAILAPLKENKTNNADHRIALVALAAALPPDSGSTVEILGILLPSIAKDGKEEGWAWVGKLLNGALVKNEEIPKDVAATLTKEMGSAKVPVRRAVCAAVGSALWDLGEPSPTTNGNHAESNAQNTWTPAATSFLTALTPALESNLKTASSTPLNLPAGPLEGYVAAAIGFARGGKEGIASKNPVLTGIAGTSAKPSFLLWDKVWNKVNDPIEETWLLRAAVGAFEWFEGGGGGKKTEGLRSALGAIFVQCAVKSAQHNTRRLALETLSRVSQHLPGKVVPLIIEAVVAATENDTIKAAKPTPTATATSAAAKPAAGAKPAAKPAAAAPVKPAAGTTATKPTTSTAPEDGPQNTSRPDPKTLVQARYAALLAAVAPDAEHVDEPQRGDLLVEMIGVAHRDDVCPQSRQLWVDLCLRVKLDPYVLVTRKVDRLLEMVLLKGNDYSGKTMESAYRALSTIVFIAPKITLPRVIAEVQRCLNPAQVEALGPVDFAVWRTPKGAMFTDVLASKKGPVLNNKSKDADIEKWEAELRKTLESKKGAPTKALSKQDQALVNAQLEKEDVIRVNVERVKTEMTSGLAMVKSLVAAGVEELSVHIAPIAKLLLDGALKKGSVLVGHNAFDTYLVSSYLESDNTEAEGDIYQDLAKMCSDRLDVFKKWIGVATLRVFEVPDVPEELQLEPLDSLIVRVLYKLRMLSEQAPFDPSTYAYMSPFIDHVIRSGGIAAAGPEETLEQISLALDVIQFHCGEFSNPAYPRIEAAR
ncbi:translational activator of GCN4, partial [Ceratobasidium sp. 392]